MATIFSITRPIGHVPIVIRYMLIITVISQCIWHYSFSELHVKKEEVMPEPGRPAIYQLASLNDSITIAKLLMLWVQAFDNQPGVSLSLKELNYERVIVWLALIMSLDENIQYPLFAASRFYTEVPDIDKKKLMIGFVKNKFLQNPDQRWASMAHAVYVAKHRIKDLQLAVEYARLLRLHATGENVPYWAKQMEFFVLEDMGELEAAMILIGGLLESGELDDKHQQEFLRSRLEDIKQRYKQNIN